MIRNERMMFLKCGNMLRLQSRFVCLVWAAVLILGTPLVVCSDSHVSCHQAFARELRRCDLGDQAKVQDRSLRRWVTKMLFLKSSPCFYIFKKYYWEMVSLSDSRQPGRTIP